MSVTTLADFRFVAGSCIVTARPTPHTVPIQVEMRQRYECILIVYFLWDPVAVHSAVTISGYQTVPSPKQSISDVP